MKTLQSRILGFFRRPDAVEAYNPDTDTFVQMLQSEVKSAQQAHDRRESPDAWRRRNSFERELLRSPVNAHGRK